jgi:hypothetical protein
MELIIIIALIAINAFTVYKYLYHLIFRNTDDFQNSVRYSFTPNIISLFRGEYWKDRVAEFKLVVFIGLCIITTVLEYVIINGLLQWIIGMWK